MKSTSPHISGNLQNKIYRVSLTEVQQLFQEIGYFLQASDIFALQRIYTLYYSDTLHDDVKEKIEQIFRESLQRGYTLRNAEEYEVFRVLVHIVTRAIVPDFASVQSRLGVSDMSFVYSDVVYKRMDVYCEQGVLQKVRNVAKSDTKRSYLVSLYLHGNVWKKESDDVVQTLRAETTKNGISLIGGQYDMERDNNMIDTAKISFELLCIEHTLLTEVYLPLGAEIRSLHKTFQELCKNRPLSWDEEYLLGLQKINDSIAEIGEKETQKE